MFRQIKEEYKHKFETANDGIFAVSIKASCKGGKFFGLLGGEDLQVELDDIKLREIPSKNNRQYYNIPPAWNGANLEGLSKTVIFILELKAGTHSIKAEDLGGLLQEIDNKGSINLKLLSSIALVSVLLLCGICFARSRKEAPIFSWRNEVELNNSSKIITDLKIFSEKKVTEADGQYCGFRFGKIYESNAELFLSHDNKIIDTVNLTNPKLVLPEFSEKYLFYYKPLDIDGDGKKQEFVVQEYASCNGNLLSFIKVNDESQKIEKMPIIYQNGEEGGNLYVDIGEDAFNLNNGNVEIKYYDLERGEFIKDYYEFDREKNKLVWSKANI